MSPKLTEKMLENSLELLNKVRNVIRLYQYTKVSASFYVAFNS